MSVIDEIAAERLRQISVEGWSLEHDDEHATGDLARLSAIYAVPPPHGRIYEEMILAWPDQADWVKHKDRRSDLIRAAALIVAEVERLDRAIVSPAPAD